MTVYGMATSDPPPSDSNIVVEWLTFLKLPFYSPAFIDNGYDTLEVVKQMGPEDLDAVGVLPVDHRAYLLDAIRVLREHGAAWVYLLTTAVNSSSGEYFDTGADGVSASSSGIASATSMPPWAAGAEDHELSGSSCEFDHKQQFPHRQRSGRSSKKTTHRRHSPVSSHSGMSCNVKMEQQSCSCATETTDCPSEVSFLTSFSKRTTTPTNGIRSGVVNPGVSLSCEELDRIQLASPGPMQLTHLQMRMLVRDKLIRDGIRLAVPPFTSMNGDRFLVELSNRYTTELCLSSPSLVLQHLEDLRLAEWSDHVPPPLHPEKVNEYVNVAQTQHEKDDIYVPGMYQPSSCLNDREGDQIYDFAAKYRQQMRQHQAKMFMSPVTWLQMAKRILSKASSKDEPVIPRRNRRLPLEPSSFHQVFPQSVSESHLPRMGPQVNFRPIGRPCSPDGRVTVLKTKVMYHTRSDMHNYNRPDIQDYNRPDMQNYNRSDFQNYRDPNQEGRI